MDALNKVPLATVLTLVSYATAVYLIVAGDIDLNNSSDFLAFFGGLGAVTFGAGKLGEARNGAGHGVQ